VFSAVAVVSSCANGIPFGFASPFVAARSYKSLVPNRQTYIPLRSHESHTKTKAFYFQRRSTPLCFNPVFKNISIRNAWLCTNHEVIIHSYRQAPEKGSTTPHPITPAPLTPPICPQCLLRHHQRQKIPIHVPYHSIHIRRYPMVHTQQKKLGL
jgi:hypothetical protein